MSAQDVEHNQEAEYEEASGSDVEYDEEEVEEEAEEEEEEEPVPEPKPRTPKKTPGKVKPSEEVKNMKLASPMSHASNLTPAKNPFTSMGKWTPQSFQEVDIQFPVFGTKSETTNDLTRNTKPEARYWKETLKFSYATYVSDTIRIDNVHIPYHNGRNYGEGFVYVCLPDFMAPRFAELGKARRPTVTGENSLQPDPNRWWKIANSVVGKVGTINKTDSKFYATNLSTIFEATGKGVTVNLVAKFLIKASTDDKSPLKPTNPQRVVLEIERAYLEETDVDVQPPTRVIRSKPKAEPVAVKTDIASDALMKRLAQLGL
jgi:hypothetical protein